MSLIGIYIFAALNSLHRSISPPFELLYLELLLNRSLTTWRWMMQILDIYTRLTSLLYRGKFLWKKEWRNLWSFYMVWVNGKIEHWQTSRQIRNEALSSGKIILSQWEGISRWLWWRCKVIFGFTVSCQSLAPRTPHFSESLLMNRPTRRPGNFLSAELK